MDTALQTSRPMRIELRNFMANQRFSEETLMFSATIYIDGKKAGTVKNDGRGGSNNVWITDYDLHRAMRAFITALPAHTYHDGDFGETRLPMTEDLYFSLLAEAEVKKKEEKRIAAKRKKSVEEMRSHGLLPFIAKLKDGSELVFGMRPTTKQTATEHAVEAAARYKTTVVSVEEVRP